MTLVTPEFRLHHYMQLALESSGLGVAEIAERLDVSRNTVSAWINGRSRPSTPVLIAWAQVTGVDAEWLCARRDSNPQPSDLYLASDRPACLSCGSAIGSPSDRCACSCHDAWGSIEVEHQLLLLAEAVVL